MTDQLTDLAHSLDCITPQELQALTGWKPSTLEAYRKRGVGPAFIKLGKNFLYPRSAIADFMADNTHTRSNGSKGQL
jgi:hypothetical protein